VKAVTSSFDAAGWHDHKATDWIFITRFSAAVGSCTVPLLYADDLQDRTLKASGRTLGYCRQSFLRHTQSKSRGC
jgi:hypothetical protein